jgi:hypothetical protein
VVVDWGGLKKTSPLTFQMADFEAQKILKKNKKGSFTNSAEKMRSHILSAIRE